MALYLDSFIDALRARIAAVWPETVTSGIWEFMHVEMVPWGEIEPPYAVIVTERFRSDAYGVANDTYSCPVQLFLVMRVKGPGNVLRQKLELLRDDLHEDNLTVGQVLDITELSWSRDSEANAVLVSNGSSARAGMLEALCLVGESPE